MDFGEAIKTCFSKYFTISGRARRSEYWYFYLFTILLGIAASVIDAIIGIGGEDLGLVGGLVTLATFIPTITAQVRRLHDTGRSGWWIGIAFIVAIVFIVAIWGSFGLSSADDIFEGTGAALILVFILLAIVYSITMLVFMCLDSQEGSNKYGPNPKHDTGAEIFD